MLHENLFKGGREMHYRVRIVKAIIVNCFKYLVLVRRKDGLLDLPGGKLEEGEGVCQGLVREVSEETGLVFERPEPVNRWILPTAKGMLNGMTFCCDYKQGRVVLSPEHTEYFWQDLDKISQFPILQWVKGFSKMNYMLIRFAPLLIRPIKGAIVEDLKCQGSLVMPDLDPASRSSNIFKRQWFPAFVETQFPESHHNLQNANVPNAKHVFRG
jgi:8-oxo-dGTP pyrophosphatase MutT (NUDIX family)